MTRPNPHWFYAQFFCDSDTLRAMKKMLDALWRAVTYCFYPSVIALSVAPLLALLLAVFAFAY